LVLAAAGVDCDAALFNHLGPEFAASFMHKTGERMSNLRWVLNRGQILIQSGW
jgi:hypothetical protein